MLRGERVTAQLSPPALTSLPCAPLSSCPPGQMIELLQHIPRGVATSGRYAREFFTREGRLRHIHRLHYWPMERVLSEKYKLPPAEVGGWVDVRGPGPTM